MEALTETLAPVRVRSGVRGKDWTAGRVNDAMTAVREGRPLDFYASIEEIFEHTPDAASTLEMAADFAAREQHWGRAVRYRAALTALNPRDLKAKVALARALVRAGQGQAADDLVRRLLETSPVGAGLRRLRLEILLSPGSRQRDVAEVERLITNLSVEPADDGVAFVLQVAQILMEADALDLAGDWLRRARPVHGQSPAFARLEANVAYRQGRWAEAEALWRALAEDADAATARQARIFRARIALSDDRRSDALDHYRQAFDNDEANAEAARYIVRTAIAQGHLEEAAGDVERFEKRVGRTPLVVQLRATLASGARDIPGAIAHFEIGLAEWPNDIDLRCRYADFFGDHGDLAGMRRVLAAAEALAPTHPAILSRLLSAGVAAGDPPAPLLAIADRLLEERPKDLGALRQKANLLIRLGERWDAVATLRRGIEADARNLAFWTGAITNLLILNDNAQAAAMVEQALAEFAGETANARIAAAEILEAGDRLAEAAEQAELAVEADPQSAPARALAARLWESRGLYRRAWPHLLLLREMTTGGARGALSFARVARALHYVDSHPAANAENEVFPAALFDRMSRAAAERTPYEARARVLHVTSSLAAGGAERQVALAVQGLATHVGAPAPELVAQDLSPLVGRDLFLPPVEEAGAPVWSLSRLRAEGAVREVVALGGEHRETVGLLSAMPTDVANIALPLYKIIVDRRPRVVHLWQDSINIAGGVAAMAAGVPRIVLGTRSTRPIERQRARPYLHAGYHALMRYPGTVVLNNSVNGAADYADWLGIEPGRIRTLHNGIDFAAMRARADPAPIAQIREQLRAGPEEVVIGGVMRCSFEKRPELWTAAVLELAKTDQRIRGVLVGEGPMRAALEAEVAAAGLSERIVFVGRQAPIEPWIGAMDILFLSSLTEGLPNVLIEAQALGVAAATMRVGGAPETVREDVTALVIDNGPIASIAQHLARLTADSALRHRFGQAGIAWTHEAFSLEAMLTRLCAIYAEG